MRLSAAVLTATVVTAALWMSLGGPDAEQVFGQAIDQAAKAKTLSAHETISYTVGGRQESFAQRVMFKQPHLERREVLKNGQVEEITITDYGRRRRLMLKPAEKEAWLSDWTNVFEIDPKTGNVVPEKLNITFRDELLSFQSRAVEDLGEVDLSGQKVRLTQSSNGKLVVKVWIDPHMNRPVQVSITRPNQEDVVSSIKIDEPLSDDLFNLEPPPGYKVVSNSTSDERVGQLFAKVKFLILQCWQYESKLPKTFPEKLSDLDLKPEVVQNLQKTPDGDDLIYVRPEFSDDISQKVILYEPYKDWPNEGIVVGFGDGHVERIANEESFKQRLKGP